MKKLLLVVVVAIVLPLLTACDNVPVGNVGILVHKLGGSKGVDSEELNTGRVWLGWNDELFIFPTYSQNESWIKTNDRDESISFQDKDGMNVNADIGITYSIKADKVSVVFQKYRKGINEISDIYLRNMVRDALVKEASTRSIETIYGEGKSDLIKDVETLVRSQVSDIGIIVEKINWMGEMRLPPSIVESINRKAQATQLTAQREQEIQQSKAEAEKKIQEARGDAESTLLRANAEAQSIVLKGKAIAENPLVIQLNAIEKWSGQLPTTMIPGSATPFINIK